MYLNHREIDRFTYCTFAVQSQRLSRLYDGSSIVGIEHSQKKKEVCEGKGCCTRAVHLHDTLEQCGHTGHVPALSMI